MKANEENLQQGEPSNRQDAASVVDAFEDSAAGESFCASMVMREISKRQTQTNNAVVDATNNQ